MRITRSSWVALALLPVLALGGGTLDAQQDSSARVSDSTSMWQNQRAYETKRAELVDQLRATQAQLSELRSERVNIEARVDNAYAESMERRARILLLSPEQSALLQLDSMLAGAQVHMLEQRDRMQALGEAVRRQSGAVLVVLLSAESVPAGGLADVQVTIDRSASAARGYSAIAIDALEHGAVDELYRGEVLPTSHLVSVSASIGGQQMVRRTKVAVPEGVVTYVQFSVRDGQLVPSTWTSQGTSPF
ncbi:MAG TPA: hypothetical protein VIQ74_17345 [Gemmatimonadaceae bacterium]